LLCVRWGSLPPRLPALFDPQMSPRAPSAGPVPRGLRVLLPALVILVWLTGAAVGGPYFGKVSEVSSNDQTTYLPESADATAVQELLSEFNDADSVPAVVVFTSASALPADRLTGINEGIRQRPAAGGVEADPYP